MGGRSLYFVLPDNTPDPCPNACGGLTEDPYGGPCKNCWTAIRSKNADDDEWAMPAEEDDL